MKKLIILFLVAFYVCGCSQQPVLTLNYSVDVPPQFRSGKSWVGGISTIDLYVGAYEKGWWMCIEKYLSDIDYNRESSDLHISGSGTTISGYTAGYKDADIRVQLLIENLGKKKTKKLLLETQDGL